MRRNFPPLLVVILLTALTMLLAPPATLAQDPLKVAPDKYKLVFENQRVRVCDVRLGAGQKIASHSHPEHFVYVLNGGRLKFSYPNGTTQDADLQVGQVVWVKAEKHAAENTGTTELHALVVELKEPSRRGRAPSKAPAKPE